MEHDPPTDPGGTYAHSVVTPEYIAGSIGESPKTYESHVGPSKSERIVSKRIGESTWLVAPSTQLCSEWEPQMVLQDPPGEVKYHPSPPADAKATKRKAQTQSSFLSPE